ncbi:uncharacterized protein A1O9_09631 [Exophiala aquamarina CBS 119918]|uniref:Ankyrin repeat protein n=1 Tax=Exophiala aquamarina CBS 119918 TaxID=1182545 RepID=A0A072P2Y0_9EURO|nr:uncharacterized protein A1O9_09631 [Exophiala aquamarina CBS 119918]KEF54464.1 hypothetical protein A1O9_09631 [Exophiala aquamarina CBS 119918]
MSIQLPKLPVPVSEFVRYAEKQPHSQAGVTQAVEPFKAFEGKLREIYAQQPEHPAVTENHLIPLFENAPFTTRARNLSKESTPEKESYLLSLPDHLRRKDGSPAIVQSLKDFRTNFNIFSESSLTELKWDNVVVAGSAVNTSLLPLDAPYSESKRALRNYYHDKLAPASDVDLFLYGLNEEGAIEKIKQIETSIRDSILAETTTVRTKNAITIASEYPVRHVQIVLRLYKSISEILTGFDVDCSCVAYDGQQVWASPRAVAAFMTQVNSIDLTRRSPSYENRLSKYSHRGFEVYWPLIDRKRIDPTIFERSFSRVQGLARLLVLEKLPLPTDRDDYLAKRREERGRPPIPQNHRFHKKLKGNLKDAQPDDIAEWVEDDVSNYHTVTIPYGPTYNAKRIEKLLFTKDLLLNAEWNKPKDREAELHRHPAFFGSIEDVIHDCCGFCPKATTDADLAVLEEEGKNYVSGDVTFLKDDPGRQAIGSFNPITNEDWTEMAYVGNTTRLCQAIVGHDLDAVRDWFSSLEETDVNRRDHAGRTPLQLAAMCSTPEIVQVLIEHGARLVSRLYNGMTALHIAAYRGEVQIVKAILDKSLANEEEESRKEDVRKTARRGAAGIVTKEDHEGGPSISENTPKSIDDSAESEEDEWEDEDSDSVTEGSYIKVREKNDAPDPLAEDKDDPDVYDVDVLAWDNPLSPLHLAILAGHINIIELLINKYGADALLPVKVVDDYDRKDAKAAILSIVLALELPLRQANDTVKALLAHGATSTQADMNHISALHYAVNNGKTLVVETLENADPAAVATACNFVTAKGYRTSPSVQAPILTAIRTGRKDLVEKVVSMGANLEITFEAFEQAYKRGVSWPDDDHDRVKKVWQRNVEQPIILAAKMQMLDFVEYAIDHGVNVNTIAKGAWDFLDRSSWGCEDKSLVDIINDHIKDLKKALYPANTEYIPKPADLEKDQHYLIFPKGTYRYWTVYHDLHDAKLLHNHQVQQFRSEQHQRRDEDQEGTSEKNAAIEQTITKLVNLEDKLRKRGAVSFRCLYPDAHRNATRRVYYPNGIKDSPYESSISFGSADSTAEKKAQYIQLFEACWTGDTETVKSLCLAKKEPLKVAVKDSRGCSPFSVATLHGHYDLAQLIVEIATVQFQPKSESEKYRYTLDPGYHRHHDSLDHGSDSDSCCDSEDTYQSDIGILAHLIKDKFTVDDITALADSVQSNVDPLTMVSWEFPVSRAVESSNESKRIMRFLSRLTTPSPYVGDYPSTSWGWFNAAFSAISSHNVDSLVRFAIVTDDIRLLRFIIKIGNELTQQKSDEGALKAFPIDHTDFRLAIRLGRVEMIAEILKSTGFGFPLQKIIQQSGVKLERSPDQYQGLTVHGKKRQHYVDAARGRPWTVHDGSDFGVPLLAAILEGNIESMEYFISDSPLRRYLEFANTFKDDKRIQALSKTDGGIEGTLTSWLETRNNLALHMAVLSPPNEDGSQPTVEYLLKKMPHLLDVRSVDGKTPLQLAFEAGRYYAAEKLINAGANQATKDNLGRNILHTILSGPSVDNHAVLRSLFDLLDKKLVPSLLLERSGIDLGTATPLVLFINSGFRSPGWEESLKLIVGFSEGKDLEKMNGAGDYPIHIAVRREEIDLVKFLVYYRPSLLYRENATGMTPVDVASTTFLRSHIDNPPELSQRNYWSIKDQSARSFVIKSEDDVEIDHEMMDDEEEKFGHTINMKRRMYRFINALVAKFPGTRKLVSLHDANEVAKRLAFLQQKTSEINRRLENAQSKRQDDWGESHHFRANAEQEAVQDEVSRSAHANPDLLDFGSLKWRKEVAKEEKIDKVIEKQRKLDSQWYDADGIKETENPFFTKSSQELASIGG